VNERSIALIDVENLVPDVNIATEQDAVDAVDLVVATAELSPSDLIVIACGPRFLKRAGFGLSVAKPGCRIVCRSGKDGADKALIDEVADSDWIESRFDRVVIGSGDHAFADAAHCLGSTSTWTLAVSWQLQAK
jgi:hypothetical protein